jgi:hypothetical protein
VDQYDEYFNTVSLGTSTEYRTLCVCVYSPSRTIVRVGAGRYSGTAFKPYGHTALLHWPTLHHGVGSGAPPYCCPLPMSVPPQYG